MRKSAFIITIFVLAILAGACNRGKSEKEYVKKVELNTESIAVGVFKATGYDYPNIDYITEALKIDAAIVYVTLTEADILKTKLENIDVLILPAMLKDQKMDRLDDEVAEIITDFITKRGNGAISLSNGGEILTKSKKYQSLDLLDIELTDNQNLEINSGVIRVTLTDDGKRMFPELFDFESVTVDYHYGPKMNVLDTSDIQVLAMAGSDESFPVLIKAKCEKGKLIFASINPELTPGMRWMIPRMVRWTFNKELIWYNRKVFRPNFYDKEVNLEAGVSEEIEELVLKLDKGKKDEVIAAMDDLQALYPISVAEKIRSMLILKNDDIKLRAAKFLVDIEYTKALEDLNTLIKKERSNKVREELIAYRNELEDILEQN